MLGYRAGKSFGKRVVITLEILKDAITNVKRSNISKAETAIYRANKVTAIKIEDSDGKTYDEAISYNLDNDSLKYTLHEEVVCHDFDMDLEMTFTSGIHFFLTKKVAETYGVKSIENGVLTQYWPNGKKYSEKTFVNGSKTTYDIWYKNGTKCKESKYLNGKLNGLQREWHVNGNKCRENTYLNDKLNGLHRVWYENGRKKFETTYVHNKIEGVARWWYENGNKCIETTYVNDKKNGVSYEWYENGAKASEYQMLNDREHGVCHDYTLYGNKTTTKYRHGRRMYGLPPYTIA